MSQLHSFVHLVIQHTFRDAFSTTETWEELEPAKRYLGYWNYLYEAGGGVKSWHDSAHTVPLAWYDPDTGFGLLEWYVHSAGSIPGIFELGRFEGYGTEPTSVERFEFTGRAIGPLPRIEYSIATGGVPVPHQKWRFWPGAYAQDVPT